MMLKISSPVGFTITDYDWLEEEDKVVPYGTVTKLEKMAQFNAFKAKGFRIVGAFDTYY
jgi:hypothetical protein